MGTLYLNRGFNIETAPERNPIIRAGALHKLWIFSFQECIDNFWFGLSLTFISEYSFERLYQSEQLVPLSDNIFCSPFNGNRNDKSYFLRQ